MLIGAPAQPADQGITGKKILLKAGKLTLLSKDASISTAGSDPVAGSDSLLTVDAGGTPVSFALPKAQWSTNGSRTLFKYSNAQAPSGPSAVKIAKVKSGLLKVVAKGVSMPVPNGAATLHVTMTLDGGTNSYCMTFTGTGDGKTFLAKDTAAGTCAVCGNNLQEATEACDGSDASACPGACQSDCTCPSSGNPLDQFLPAGALSLVGASPERFNGVSDPLQFSLTGANFDTSTPEDISLIVNGSRVSASQITVLPDLMTANVTLNDGLNTISLKAYDTIGRPLYYSTTLWAGDSDLEVVLVNPDGSPFIGSATVVAVLSDDQSVTEETSTSTGSVVFHNVPSRTILIKATGSGNETGAVGALGWQGSVVMEVVGFEAPSPIDNNDFSQDAAGWDVGTAPISIVPHLESIPGFPAAAQGGGAGLGRATLASVDQDLVLGTAGEGEQKISRTFTTQPGTTAVRLRYRFVTSEVPGGYFGSEYNDYFRVSIRSQQGGGSVIEANSMNGLGLAAFDYPSGSTNWREQTLPVDVDGDTIQVDVGVANVGDDLYDSQVVVDFVQEIRDEIRPQLAWNSTTGGLDVRYEIRDTPTSQSGIIEGFWASGPGNANRIGAAVFSVPVPMGTAPGNYGPFHVDGSTLQNDPAGVTHLIAVSSPTQVAAVKDVRVEMGANADPAAVSAGMLDVGKDGLRAGGQTTATITSTARTPADQARAMFKNLVNSAHPVAVNVQNQLAIYAPPGDAVIGVFVAESEGLTLPQILTNSASIQAAMEAEIINQGPSNVSHHCADPTAISVADVYAGVFNVSNGPLFVSSVIPRLTRFIDERTTNACYHLELNR